MGIFVFALEFGIIRMIPDILPEEATFMSDAGYAITLFDNILWHFSDFPV